MDLTDTIRGAVATPSSSSIAQAVARLAADGEIAPGERLPTVRALATELAVSPSTVAEAWRTLAARGVLDTRGRNGTFLRDVRTSPQVRHFRQVYGADLHLDLSTGYPDPELLPDLRPALERVAQSSPLDGYPTRPMAPALNRVLGEALPFSPESLTVGTDVIHELAELIPILTSYGERAVVAEHEFPPYLDLLERHGVGAVPVPEDDDGLLPGAVEAAVSNGARLVILQPRAHNPTGTVMPPHRADQIAEMCRRSGAWIVEVDHFGFLAESPAYSVAPRLPERTIYLRSFAKDVHPDIRVCAVAASTWVVQELLERRLGGSWVSHLNQRLLSEVLQSPSWRAHVTKAKEEYARRRAALESRLQARGVDVRSREGLNLWIPVRSEDTALIYLASHGVGAAPGRPFAARRGLPPHIRISIAAVRDNLEELADLLASAATTRRLVTHEDPNLHFAFGAASYAVGPSRARRPETRPWAAPNE